MGVEPYLVASVLEGVLAQRLGRRICDVCKEEVAITEDLSHRLSQKERELLGGKMWIGRGCEKCNDTGSRGRIGFFELVTLSGKFRAAVSENLPVGQLSRLLPDAHTDMRRDGMVKVSQGLTTISEVLRATQDADEI